MSGPNETEKSGGSRMDLNAQLARDVLTMAALGGMPDTYWLHDSRIARACKVLGWEPDQARTWAHNHRADW